MALQSKPMAGDEFVTAKPYNELRNDLTTHTHDGVDTAHVTVPACRVFHSVAQSIPNSTDTVLAFDGERYDTDAIHDTVTNNSRLTCKTAGKYRIFGNIAYAANTTGTRVLDIVLNNTTIIASIAIPAATIGETRLCLSTTWQLAVNDFVVLRTWQNSGGALNVVAAPNYSPEFGMERIG